MQIKSLRTIAYRSWAIDDTTPPEAVKRLKKIEQYRQMREQGLSEDIALNEGLAGYLKCYNEYRSHQALDSMTPSEYFQQWMVA